MTENEENNQLEDYLERVHFQIEQGLSKENTELDSFLLD